MILLRPTKPIEDRVEEALTYIPDVQDQEYEEDYLKQFPDSASTQAPELQMDELIEYAEDHSLLNQSHKDKIDSLLRPQRARMGIVSNSMNEIINNLYCQEVSDLRSEYRRIRDNPDILDGNFQAYSDNSDRYLFLEELDENLAEELRVQQEWVTQSKTFVQEDLFEEMDTTYPVITGILEAKQNIEEMQTAILRETAGINSEKAAAD